MIPLPPDHLDLARFKSFILSSCGLSFEESREKALAAALRRRMVSISIDDPEAYYRLITREQAELDRLVALLTVNETYFFREPIFLRLATDRLIPEFLGEKKTGPVKILSAGCATGEEPYSLAILLRERFGMQSTDLFLVSGVDIDGPAIEVAKAGVYRKNSFRGVDEVLLNRYFEPYGSGNWKIKDEIRTAVTFEVVNLLSGLFSDALRDLDIIFYRNVSIYFPSPVQRSIFSRLANLLREGGALIVGASETLQHDIGILTLVEQDGLFFYRKLPGFSIEERRGLRRHVPPIKEKKQVSSPVTSENRPSRSGRNKRAAIHKPPTVSTRPVSATPMNGADDRNVKSLFDDAMALAAEERFTNALSVLDTLFAVDKNFLKAQVLSAGIHLTLSQFDEARLACETAISIDPLNLEACLMLGIIERHEGHDEEAHRRFRQAIYLNPSCWLAQVHMAEIAYARKDWKLARGGYSVALKVLESGSIEDHGREFSPLVIKAEPFLVICRHKLSLLKEKGLG